MLANCNFCSARLNVPDRLENKKGKCPKCKNIILLSKFNSLEDEKINDTKSDSEKDLIYKVMRSLMWLARCSILLYCYNRTFNYQSIADGVPFYFYYFLIAMICALIVVVFSLIKRRNYWNIY